MLANDLPALQHRYGVVVYGRRDHYQVALALHEAGVLERVFTDFYTPHWLVNLTDRVVPPLARKLRLRHHPALNAGYFESDLLKKQLLSYYWSCRGLRIGQRYALLNDFLSKRAARYATRHAQVGMLCYSYYWRRLAAVRAAGLWSGVAIVFQVHPVASQIRRILAEDRAKTGLSYSPEEEEVAAPEMDRDYLASLQQAHGAIATSSFTARGLVEAGMAVERVRVVPYGSGSVGTRAHPPLAERRWERQVPLRLLWVGQLAYRKAAHHLFDAVRRFSPSQVELSVVSRSWMPPELAALVPPNATVLDAVSDDQRQEMYRTHHLFVLPSLVEGFGLVYVEALAEGLPILCTTNTGGPDVIEDGVEGFIVPPGDAEAIASVIEGCLMAPDLLPAMSEAARTLAAHQTWRRFRAGVRANVAVIEHFAGQQNIESASPS
jgi:glycosyltransferase involved in cell wall biosynthesis